MGKIELSVISPLYNEENVELFYLSLTQALESVGLDYEVILVDDGSNHKTAALYDALAHKDSNVRIVHHPVNLGQQVAVLSGFRVCRGERILVLDGDIEVKAVDIRKFCRLFDQGHDAIFGIRKAWDRPFYRRVLSRCLNLLVSLIAGRRIHDVGTGFLLFSRQLFARVIHRQARMNSHNQPINIMAYLLADNPSELEIKSRTMGRESRYSLFKIIKFTILILHHLYTLLPSFWHHLSVQDWNKVAEKIDASLDNPDFAYFRDDKYLCYQEFYGLNPHSREVLDVGCGPGHLVLFCANRAIDITGIDSSPGMLNLARKRLQQHGHSASLLQVDISKELPFKKATFDTIVCESVLNHIDDPANVLKEICRVLKDEGHLVLDVSNSWGIAWRLAIFLSQMSGSYPKGRIHWISPTTAHRLAREAGFQVMKSRGLHFLPPPKITTIDFKCTSLLPAWLEGGSERQLFRLNHFLEHRGPFSYFCFKYLLYCSKKEAEKAKKKE